MFLVTNRYVVHATVVSIAAVAGIVNLQLTEVRASAGTFGQQSLLYRVVTDEDVEVIEEYAEPYELLAGDTAAVDGVLKPSTGVVVPASTGTAMALGGGSLTLAAPNADRSFADSVVPRTSTITYKVEEGDTLSTIAQKFGLSLNTVLWANNLTVRSLIKPGMNLAILPVDGLEHSVRSGDTISSIAKKYSVEADAILAYNNINTESALTVGQELLVPGGKVVAPPPVTRTVAVRDIFTTAPSSGGGSTTLAPGARMVWPTDLRYIVRKLSWFHTGWDIDCNGHSDGTSTNDNYAAMDGIVQYSGAKSGYGLTVEINHGNGLVTRYGHFHTLYVSAGESVVAGAPIGRCGSTGNSTGTHLHFEVIVNGGFQNPGAYLGY